jgi:molybdopterin synthase catalytic subunit
MRRQLTLSKDKIDEPALLKGRAMSKGMGAMVCFLGVVREAEPGGKISGIDYEAFEKMALHQLGLICDQAAQRWPVESVRLVHRVGRVAVGEASVWAEVIAPHREEAFAACQFLISEMKRVVPIWKHVLG